MSDYNSSLIILSSRISDYDSFTAEVASSTIESSSDLLNAAEITSSTIESDSINVFFYFFGFFTIDWEELT